MDRIRNANLRAALLVTAVATVVAGFVGGGFASAQSSPPTLPADPTGGALDDAGTTVQTWVLTYAVPVIFALTLLGIMVRLGRKWLRRAGGAV